MAEEVAFLSKDYKDGGIFILSEHEDKLIRSSMKNLNCTANVKFVRSLGMILLCHQMMMLHLRTQDMKQF